MDRIDAPTSRLTSDAAERLDRLFRLYSAQVLAIAGIRAQRPADAADIAGLAWLKACKTISRLEGPDSEALPWLTTIARRAAVEFYRPARTTERPSDWADDFTIRQLPAAPPAETEAPALVLADLTVQQATAMKLAAQGLTNSAIAARLGKSHQAVQQNLKGGARRLRAAAGLPEPRPRRRRASRVRLVLAVAALLPVLACSDGDGASIAEQQAADALAAANIASANAAAAAAEAARQAAEAIRNGGQS